MNHVHNENAVLNENEHKNECQLKCNEIWNIAV